MIDTIYLGGIFRNRSKSFGRWFAIAGWLPLVFLIDGNNEFCEIILAPGCVRRWKGHDYNVSALVFASDGRLVSGSGRGFVTTWDGDTGTEVWSRDAGDGMVFCVSGLADGRAFWLSVGMTGPFGFSTGVTGREIMACRGAFSLGVGGRFPRGPQRGLICHGFR